MNVTGVYELVGGPHDGAEVREVGLRIPKLIFTDKAPSDRGYVVWSCRGSARYPVRYSLDAGRFKFVGYV